MAFDIGALLGGFAGSGGSYKKVSRFDKDQRDLFSLLKEAIQGGGGPFGDLVSPFDEEAAGERFEQGVARPALDQFREQIIPQITGQFRGQNLGESSYLGQGLSREGSRLESDLAAAKANQLFQGREAGLERRLKALQNYLGTQTFDYMPKTNTLDNILKGAGYGLQAGQSALGLFGG